MIASWRSYTCGVISAAAFFALINVVINGSAVIAGGHERPNANDAAPVYMITVGRMVSDGDLMPYTMKMLEAANGRDMESLAFNSSFQVFEGTWDHDGFLSVERAPSMAALEAFWASEAYQEAIPLRDGIIKIDYAVAVEGR